MSYDFDRPLVEVSALAVYWTRDDAAAHEYGSTVRAGGLSNAEYAARHRALSSRRRMKPAASHQRIISGYLVVRKPGTGYKYETWMPGHVFDELYVPDR